MIPLNRTGFVIMCPEINHPAVGVPLKGWVGMLPQLIPQGGPAVASTAMTLGGTTSPSRIEKPGAAQGDMMGS
jgi:hypothetical protein